MWDMSLIPLPHNQVVCGSSKASKCTGRSGGGSSMYPGLNRNFSTMSTRPLSATLWLSHYTHVPDPNYKYVHTAFISNLPLKIFFYWWVDIIKLLWCPSSLMSLLLCRRSAGEWVFFLCDSDGGRRFQVHSSGWNVAWVVIVGRLNYIRSSLPPYASNTVLQPPSSLQYSYIYDFLRFINESNQQEDCSHKDLVSIHILRKLMICNLTSVSEQQKEYFFSENSWAKSLWSMGEEIRSRVASTERKEIPDCAEVHVAWTLWNIHSLLDSL